tara:strand:+ start:4822 stop:5367 length:546 start_codon:yes stop_codon:yes gene_type:complete
MWICSNCDEEHGDEFDVCWNCGTNNQGDRDLEFTITEPNELVTNDDCQSWDCDSLQLPDTCYYSFPLFCLLFPVALLQLDTIHWQSASVDDLLGRVIVAAVCFGPAIFLGFQILALLLRIAFRKVLRNDPPPSGDWTISGILEVVRLPKRISSSNRWFPPIYYCSFLFFFVGPSVSLICSL